jgi:hypothetical protein
LRKTTIRPPSRRTTGAKSKRCCRDGARVELFEGPPRKRANVDHGEEEPEEEPEEDSGDKITPWQTDGSPPPPDTATLTRIAELANLRSSDGQNRVQNLLSAIQKQTCVTLNSTSGEGLTLKGLISKCQTNDDNSHYLSFISIIDNIRLAFHLAVYAFAYSTIAYLLTRVCYSASKNRQNPVFPSWRKIWG